MDKQSAAGYAVTGNFSINAQLPSGKTISVSGYLYDEESIESVNGRLDILHDVVDRQRTRAEIPELEAKRDQMIKNLAQMLEHMEGVAAKKAQNPKSKLNGQEQLALDNLNVSVEKARVEIDRGAEAILVARKFVGLA